MYEYDFETVSFGILGRPNRDYHELVRAKAVHGWPLLQIVTLPDLQSLELIFERPAKGPQDLLRADGPDELDAPASYQTPPTINPAPPAGRR